MFSNRSKGIHNHIGSLGINETIEVEDSTFPLIGQDDSRLACSIIVDIVRTNKFGGKCFILSGPSGSGKTALTVAMSKELGTKIPFVSISGHEVYSSEVKKSEVLESLLRKAVLVRMKEFKNVYEGEVVSIRDSVLDLRSLKGTKTLRLSKDLVDQMKFQDIKVGDVIHVDSSSGILKRMGRGESHLNDYDLEAEKYVPLPKNEIYKKKEFVHETTLHSLDISNINPTGQDVLSLVNQVVKYKKSEITSKLRKDVDNLIELYDTEIVYGILLIEEAHMLDLESFTYLSKAMDSEKCPVIILTTNITEGEIRGTALGPLGIPRNFLKKCLVLPIQKNDKEDEILKCRVEKENIKIDEQGFKKLVEISSKFGLVYSINLLKMMKNIKREVTQEDVNEFSLMFKNK
ncbi:RuvB-like helicase 1 (RUVB1) [Vairimorpha necatrix]|uniref:RuvB-like helicase n=1 Tax=Vairimorpha necatrix TaxID=6039 RepID=A0AAX4JGI1_9MICR